MIIKQETPQDYNAVYLLIKQSFETAEHKDGTEQDLVVALRKSKAFIPKLSLIAQEGSQIIGHILMTKGTVGQEPVLILAPLSVLPAFQKQGVGTELIKKAHTMAQQLGYSYCLVLGSEKYYPRLGYLPAEQFGIQVPFGIPSENFMAIQLTPNVPRLQGTVTYPTEFGL